MFWDNNNIPPLPDYCQTIFNKYTNIPAFQADLLRYFLLNKYGGIYLDCDFICYQNFSKIITKDFFCVQPNLKAWYATNAVFACEKDNPILTNLLKDILTIRGYLGPILFSKYILLHMQKPEKTNVFNASKTSDYVQCEDPKNFYLKNGLYCYHDALKSWLPNNR
jgi:mannosyltransferase OCH1-like enzyme